MRAEALGAISAVITVIVVLALGVWLDHHVLGIHVEAQTPRRFYMESAESVGAHQIVFVIHDRQTNTCRAVTESVYQGAGLTSWDVPCQSAEKPR